MRLDTVVYVWIAALLAYAGFHCLLYVVRKTDEARARRARPDPSEHIPEGWQ
jgi:hypothetical protein